MSDKAADLARLHAFFSFLAAGDHLGALSKALGSTPPSVPQVESTPTPLTNHKDTCSIAGPKAATAHDVDELAAFATNDNFEFTFNHMIHHLYDIADFKRMVEGVLEESRLKYKPLADELIGQKSGEVMVVEVPEEATAMDVRALKKRCVEETAPISGVELQDGGSTYHAIVGSFDKPSSGETWGEGVHDHQSTRHSSVTSPGTASRVPRHVLDAPARDSTSSEDELRAPSSAGSPQLMLADFGTNDAAEQTITRPRMKRRLEN